MRPTHHIHQPCSATYHQPRNVCAPYIHLPIEPASLLHIFLLFKTQPCPSIRQSLSTSFCQSIRTYSNPSLFWFVSPLCICAHSELSGLLWLPVWLDRVGLLSLYVSTFVNCSLGSFSFSIHLVCPLYISTPMEPRPGQLWLEAKGSWCLFYDTMCRASS